MKLRAILSRETRQVISRIGLVILVAGWFPANSFADEILFKAKGVQVGTVLEEDEQTVTIRFPKESIQSVVRMQKGAPPAQKSDAQLLEKVEQLQQRIERLEKKQTEPKEAVLPSITIPRPERKQEEGKSIGGLSLPPPEPAAPKGTIQEQLLKEELGRVQGDIFWQGKPMAKGKVRIVLEKYTGVSLTSVKKMLAEKGENLRDRSKGYPWERKRIRKDGTPLKRFPPEHTVFSGGLILKRVGFIGFATNPTLKCFPEN